MKPAMEYPTRAPRDLASTSWAGSPSPTITRARGRGPAMRITQQRSRTTRIRTRRQIDSTPIHEHQARVRGARYTKNVTLKPPTSPLQLPHRPDTASRRGRIHGVGYRAAAQRNAMMTSTHSSARRHTCWRIARCPGRESPSSRIHMPGQTQRSITRSETIRASTYSPAGRSDRVTVRPWAGYNPRAAARDWSAACGTSEPRARKSRYVRRRSRAVIPGRCSLAVEQIPLRERSVRGWHARWT